MSRKNTEEETQETTTQSEEPVRSSVEVNELSFLERRNFSPLRAKNTNDGWSYYWAKAEGSGIGSVVQLRTRGYEKVKAHSDSEIPTFGGQRNEKNEVVYGDLVLMKRPKELTEKDKEAKIREYRRLANQKEEEFEEAMEREGATHQPNRSSFYFAENPLAK